MYTISVFILTLIFIPSYQDKFIVDKVDIDLYNKYYHSNKTYYSVYMLSTDNGNNFIVEKEQKVYYFNNSEYQNSDYIIRIIRVYDNNIDEFKHIKHSIIKLLNNYISYIITIAIVSIIMILLFTIIIIKCVRKTKIKVSIEQSQTLM